MRAVLAETTRVLAPGGRLYASVGPLWFAAGGDHFSGRAPLADVFAHVDRDPLDYRRFFDRNRQPVEDFQSGGRYVEIDLFSKLTLDGYLAAIEAAGFDREYLSVQVSHLAPSIRAPLSRAGSADPAPAPAAHARRSARVRVRDSRSLAVSCSTACRDRNDDLVLELAYSVTSIAYWNGR